MRDVPKWLEDLGLGEYAEAFAENKIDPDVLPSLTSDDLKDIGVTVVGDRRQALPPFQVSFSLATPGASIHDNACRPARR